MGTFECDFKNKAAWSMRLKLKVPWNDEQVYVSEILETIAKLENNGLQIITDFYIRQDRCPKRHQIQKKQICVLLCTSGPRPTTLIKDVIAVRISTTNKLIA